MGVVYEAEHSLLKRSCAIKLIHPDRRHSELTLARFEREVRATARLTHPNTIEVFDFGQTIDGLFYYVMEFLPGLNLAELVKRYGRLPPGRACYFLRQVCGALQEAHDADLIHRDIKPGNLFSCHRGGAYDVAKVLDFGLVWSVGGDADSRFSEGRVIVGTPAFMAPEQGVALGAVDNRQRRVRTRSDRILPGYGLHAIRRADRTGATAGACLAARATADGALRGASARP